MSATMPLFSVIVPVYNVAPYLAECLDSVLSQSCADWECFCVDDGSRDGSGSLLDVYARRDARFRITHQPNAGVSSARNRALDTTYGQWVWFVDGDDAIHPEALAVLSETIASYPEVQAIAFRQALVRWEPFRFRPLSDRPLSEMRKTAFGMKAFSQTAWILLFQREQIGKRRFPAYCVGEDGLFSIGYYLGISRWVDTALPLYYYRARENSVMHTRPTERFLLDWLDMLYARVCLLSPRDVISMGGAEDYLRGLQALAWYTRDFGLFRLPVARRRQLLPAWLRLVGALNAVVPFPRLRRWAYYLIAETHSPRLLNLLVAWPAYARIRLGGLRRALFH